MAVADWDLPDACDDWDDAAVEFGGVSWQRVMVGRNVLANI